MGRRIDDHSFFAGRSSAESVLPVGNKVQMTSSVEGSGSISGYPDMDDLIVRDQKANVSKAKERAQPAGRRN